MLGRLLDLIRPYRWRIYVGLALNVLATPLQNLHPLFWMFVIDEVIERERHELLWVVVGAMVVTHYLGTAISASRTWLLGVAAQRFVADLRARLHEKLARQSLAYMQNRRSGDLMSRVIGDVDTLQDLVINGVDTVINSALSFLWVAGVIVWLCPEVGALILAPLGCVALAVWIFNRRVKGLYRRVRDALGDLSAHLQEHLAGSLIVKAFAREAFIVERFGQHNEDYTRESMKQVKVRALYFPSVIAIGFLSNVAMIGVGGYYAIQGWISVGTLVAYRGYWWQLFSPVHTLAQVNEMLQRAKASAARIFEVFDAPETVADAPDAKAPADFEGHLEFESVSFAYVPDKAVLREVSFEVKPGQQVGIAGPSGGGKSTTLGLILRFFDPQAGRVRLDGYDLRELTQASFRRRIALVSQEPFLFNDTVKNNILFGRLDATAAEIEEAAKLANAHEFIQALPNGYDTQVGERGVKLSGGQKQRLCIARAFLADARVLLLDEATASVEAESEALIQGALERLMKGRTTVIVTHRLSMVRGCDTILVVQDGRMAERGTHEELLAAGGWYARMYPLQMEGAAPGV